MDYYILDGKNPVPVDNFLDWAIRFESATRVVAKTQLEDCLVSTVFLGLNHQCGDMNMFQELTGTCLLIVVIGIAKAVAGADDEIIKTAHGKYAPGRWQIVTIGVEALTLLVTAMQ